MWLSTKKIGVILCLVLFAPVAAYGYASSINTLNANWKTRTLTVCILNNAETEYEDLFIDAINTWSGSWSYLQYNFGTPFVDSCNINAYIVNAYADLTSKGHVGVTDTRYQPGGAIIKSDILIPTKVEREDGSIYKYTSILFYRIALHEFGHAIGLLHTSDENYEEPIDIMAPFVARDDQQMLISEVDTEALNSLYKVETEYTPPEEREIEPLPPTPTLPEVLQKMEIDIERAVYFTNENLKFTVRPPTTVTGMQATIILYPPEGRDRVVIHQAADQNGIINVEVPLQGRVLGIWTVRVTYVSWVSETAFALKAAGSVAPEVQSISGEFSLKSDQSTYELNEAVALYTKTTKKAGWWLVVLDSQGRIFATLHPESMKLKSDGTYEAIFTLKGDPVKSVGTWKVRLMEGSIPAVEKSSITFEVAPAQIAKAEVKVQAKQIKDLVLLRLRNMDNSRADVYGLIVKSGEHTIEACKGAKQWNVESCEPNMAILFTNDSPVSPGGKTYFKLKVTKGNMLFNWEAYDKGRRLLDSDSLRPLFR